MVTGDTALARMDYSHHETQRVVVNVLVPVPPRNGHWSVLAGEVLRRRTRVNGAATLRNAIELGEHAMSFSGSPGVRQA